MVAKIGWQSLTGKVALGIESSASIQKNSPETVLLNLQGLAGGDTSISGQFSYRGFFRRPPERLKEVCGQVNLAIETQIREDRGGLFAEPLRGNTCTVDALRDAGGEFATVADKVELGAEEWACVELSKLNPDIVLTPPNLDLEGRNAPPKRFGKTGDCTADKFIEAAQEERTRRERDPKLMDAQNHGKAAISKRAELLKKIAANEINFAGASDPAERQRLTSERQLLTAQVAEQDQIITTSNATIKEALPDLLTKPRDLLDAKQKEMLAAACKRFNEPDRSIELSLLGNQQGCVLSQIEKSIATLTDPRVRDRLRWEVVANLPAAVWAFT
ncbi:MAG TPA: hypothetical protein VLE27_17480, partial [Thermoanaerobaculia bacterium]|nr:hypothetical protein [Thermoanaerobaculia bacterium]